MKCSLPQRQLTYSWFRPDKTATVFANASADRPIGLVSIGASTTLDHACKVRRVQKQPLLAPFMLLVLAQLACHAALRLLGLACCPYWECVLNATVAIPTRA